MKMVRDLTLDEIMELRMQFTSFQTTGPATGHDEDSAVRTIAFDLIGFTRAAFEKAQVQPKHYQD